MDNQNLIPQQNNPAALPGPSSVPQQIVSGQPIYITKPPVGPDIPLPPYTANNTEPDIPGSRIYNGQPAQTSPRTTEKTPASLLKKVENHFTVEDQISSGDYGPANDDYEEPDGNKKLKNIIIAIVSVFVIGILGFLSHKALGNNRPTGTCAQPEGSMCVIAVTNTDPSYLVFFYTGSKIITKGHIVYLASQAIGDNNAKFWIQDLGSSNAGCSLGNQFQFSFRANYSDQPALYNGCYSSDLKNYQGEVTKSGRNYLLNLSSSRQITKFQALAIIETVHIN